MCTNSQLESFQITKHSISQHQTDQIIIHINKKKITIITKAHPRSAPIKTARKTRPNFRRENNPKRKTRKRQQHPKPTYTRSGPFSLSKHASIHLQGNGVGKRAERFRGAKEAFTGGRYIRWETPASPSKWTGHVRKHIQNVWSFEPDTHTHTRLYTHPYTRRKDESGAPFRFSGS